MYMCKRVRCTEYSPESLRLNTLLNHFLLSPQAKAPDGELVVNFDPLLLQVIQEVHHLSCPPLNMRMPPVIKSLMKAVNEGEVRDRHMSLELVMQTYRDIQAGMKEEERVLLHNTLQQVEIVRM